MPLVGIERIHEGRMSIVDSSSKVMVDLEME